MITYFSWGTLYLVPESKEEERELQSWYRSDRKVWIEDIRLPDPQPCGHPATSGECRECEDNTRKDEK